MPHRSRHRSGRNPEPHAARIAFIIASGHDRFECQWKRKDGAIIDVAVTATYRAQDGGEFFCFIRDQAAEFRRAASTDALALARQLGARLDEHILHIDSLLIAAGAAVSGDLDDNIDLVSVMLDREGRVADCNDFLLRLTGLKAEQILLEAGILAVADVVEAMPSHRPYRPGLGIEEVLEEIVKHRATHFDAAAVDARVKLFREKDYTPG